MRNCFWTVRRSQSFCTHRPELVELIAAEDDALRTAAVNVLVQPPGPWVDAHAEDVGVQRKVTMKAKKERRRRYRLRMRLQNPLRGTVPVPPPPPSRPPRPLGPPRVWPAAEAAAYRSWQASQTPADRMRRQMG